MKKFRVLIIDDEPGIIRFLKIKLKATGYDVISANNGWEALEMVQGQEPDLLVLDVLMPGLDGFETLRHVRNVSSVPVIMLSAKQSNTDKIKGLQLGADDYLAKPFSPDELVARIEAIRRRLLPDSDRQSAELISNGNITVDTRRRLVVVNGHEIQLTRIEWLLLSELARNSGKLMLYSDLMVRIWGSEYRDDIQILRTWISRLRKKIEIDPDQPEIIRTIPKAGYMMEQPNV